MLKPLVRISAIVILTAAAAAAQPAQPAGSLTDVTGTWVMELAGHQMALELEQKDSRVEGIMHAMGQRVLLVGDYKDRALTLKGERPEDGAGHDGKAGPIVATMLDNGMLEGELSTNHGRMKWTGERFKKR
jgi:hypothetical protein